MSQLFICAYMGMIATLRFDPDEKNGDRLREVSRTMEGSPAPSWLSLDPKRRILYSTSNNPKAKTGTLSAFSIEKSGSLTKLGEETGHLGAAHHIVFDDGRLLACAYAFAARLTTFDVTNPAHLKKVQDFALQNPHRDQAFPHHVVIDPSGRYLLASDMRSGFVRVYRMNRSSTTRQVTELEELDPLVTDPEFFPRHTAMVTLCNGETRLYVLGESSLLLAEYKVTYRPDDQGLQFEKQNQFSIMNFPDTKIGKTGLKVMSAHLKLAPGNEFLLLSVRGDASFTIPSAFHKNQHISSDSILTYRVDSATGALSFVGAAPAGGSYPRQFSINGTGDKIAVTAQHNGWVSIFDRNSVTGEIGELVGIQGGYGEGDMGTVCVLWDSGDE